ANAVTPSGSARALPRRRKASCCASRPWQRRGLGYSAALGGEAQSRDLSPLAIREVVHDELGEDEVLSEVEVAQRRPRFIDLLPAVDAVAMQQRDVRAIGRELGAKHAITER